MDKLCEPRACEIVRGTLFKASIVAALAGSPSSAFAVEGGTSAYLLGSSGPAAAIMPPLAGLYFQNDTYLYQGRLSGSSNVPLGGNIAASVKATALINLSTFVYVPTTNFLGGTWALTATLPVGGPNVSAGAVLTGPRGNRFGAKANDSISTIGDPYVSSFVGWKSGNFYWQAGVSANLPIGNYESGALANLAFNRKMADVFGAATWLDPAIGLDVSGKVGFSFNGKNPSTNYRSGNEFHAEWAVEQHFSKTFSAGIVGYHYQQISDDRSAGAIPGPFRGRVTALGATVGYNFQIDKLPVAMRIKVFREFNAVNRLEATAGFLTVSMPLYVKQ